MVLKSFAISSIVFWSRIQYSIIQMELWIWSFTVIELVNIFYAEWWKNVCSKECWDDFPD